MSHPALSRLGQKGYLDGVVEIAFATNLWSVQRRIARALGTPRARVIVPSCNSSGKSFLGGALPLAYFLAYPTSKVILTSSREDQLESVLWAELRRHYRNSLVEMPANLPPREMRLFDSESHFIVGHSPAKPEGLKGYHGPHVLVVVDEGSHMPESMGAAIMTLLASGDARLLVLLNPTSSNSWAARLASAPAYTTIRITAFDTPNLAHLTNQEIFDRWGENSLPDDRIPRTEPCPPNADLISADFLDEMVSRGEGPGSFEWETAVMARFWSAGTNCLIPPEHYDAARTRQPTPGPVFFGVDLAAYGDSESVVAIRVGNNLHEIVTRQRMEAEPFWRDVVGPLVRKYSPSMVIFDCDGVGAGTIGVAREVSGVGLLPFRGQYKVGYQWLNTRSMWWWKLRNRFLLGDICIGMNDTTLRRQLTSINYDFTDQGLIKVESKHSLHKRGFPSPDRGDACMYAFAHDAPRIDPNRPKPPDPSQLWGRAARNAKKAQARSKTVAIPRVGVRLPR